MKPVYFTPYGIDAASSRARLYEWLKRTRPDAEVHNYLGSRNLKFDVLRRNAGRVAREEVRLRRLARVRRPHVFLQRMATPFGRGTVEGALLKSADLSVYDFDDALMSESRGNAMRRFVTSRSEQCRTAVEHADVVIAGSDRLAEWAAEYSRDVRVIPTCVDPDEYPAKASYDIAGAPVIGWLGSPSTERYLRAVNQPLLELNRRNGARLLVVSSGAADLGPLESMTDRVEWTLGGYGSAIAKADVAIAPLVDIPNAWGKCAYKMLQYAAIGLPTVASPIGANTVAAARLGAHTATDSSEWIDGIMDLLTMTPQSRSLRGTEARRAVTEHYSYARWRDAWLAAQGLQ